ncbi:MAG: energy transducer TonB [Breznakibacter sp.]
MNKKVLAGTAFVSSILVFIGAGNMLSVSARTLLPNNGIGIDTLENDTVYSVVDQMPNFPGGKDGMLRFIASNIRYPVDAIKRKEQGIVLVGFIVGKEGLLEEVTVAESSRYKSLDNEAVRMVKRMPKWIPGLQNGSPVRVKYTVPVRFRIR